MKGEETLTEILEIMNLILKDTRQIRKKLANVGPEIAEANESSTSGGGKVVKNGRCGSFGQMNFCGCCFLCFIIAITAGFVCFTGLIISAFVLA